MENNIETMGGSTKKEKDDYNTRIDLRVREKTNVLGDTRKKVISKEEAEIMKEGAPNFEKIKKEIYKDLKKIYNNLHEKENLLYDIFRDEKNLELKDSVLNRIKNIEKFKDVLEEIILKEKQADFDLEEINSLINDMKNNLDKETLIQLSNIIFSLNGSIDAYRVFENILKSNLNEIFKGENVKKMNDHETA